METEAEEISTLTKTEFLTTCLIVLHDLSTHKPSSDLVGASTNSVELGVSHDAADWVLIGVAVSS